MSALPDEAKGVPKPSEWGPIYWELLHSCAERIGSPGKPELLLNDQRQEMINILKYVETTLPCQVCRKHYIEWKKKYPVERLPKAMGAFAPAIREWLYKLHENVNSDNKVISGFSLADLETKYKSVNMDATRDALFILLERAARLRAIDSHHLSRLRVHLKYLSKII